MQKSEHKIKGTFISATRKYFNHQFGPQYFEINWRRYYEDSLLLSSSWYDIYQINKWLHDCAAEHGIGFRELQLRNVEFVVSTDLNGVYKFLMNLGGAKRIIGALQQLGKSFANCVEVEFNENISGYSRISFSCPTDLKEFFLYGLEAGLKAILIVCKNEFVSFTVYAENSYNSNGIQYSKTTVELNYK